MCRVAQKDRWQSPQDPFRTDGVRNCLLPKTVKVLWFFLESFFLLFLLKFLLPWSSRLDTGAVTCLSFLEYRSKRLIGGRYCPRADILEALWFSFAFLVKDIRPSATSTGGGV